MDGALLALHAGLDAVLRLQDGIIRRDQAMAAGLVEPTLDGRVRRGRWIRVLPRVYAVDVDPATPTSRVRATALWAGDDAVITGHAAAWWWGLTDRPPDEVEVVVPPALRTGVTSSELDAALELGFHRRGQLRARRSRDQVRDNPWSHPERALHQHFREAGLTGWTANPAVCLGGQEWYPDVLFEEIKLIVEVDGRKYHSTPEQHDRDHRRQNAFIDHGFLVLRFTARQIAQEPAAVVALVRRAVARRRCTE